MQIIVLVFFLLLSGCGGSSGGDDNATPITNGEASASFADLQRQAEGSWTGTWVNSTFRTTGGLTGEIEIAGETGIGIINVTGIVFGFMDPGPETLSDDLILNGETISFSVTSSTAGVVQVTLTPDGSGGFNFTAMGSDVPGAGVSSYTVTGNFRDGMISGDSTIVFLGGGTAAGGFSASRS